MIKNMVNNDELHIRLRKNQNTLAVVGLGVIAFGVWSVLKGVLYAALNSDRLQNTLEGNMERVIFWLLIGIVLAIDLVFRLYVGLSAISEGKGRKKGRGYIVLAFLMALSSFALFALGIVFLRGSEALGTSIVSLVVEATSCVLLVEMALSAIKVRRLRKALKEQEG